MTGYHRWNPNQSEGLLGPEWLPNQNRSWVVGSTAGANASVLQRFIAAQSDSPDAFRIFAGNTGGSGPLLLEVLEEAAAGGPEPIGSVTRSICALNDLQNVTNFKNQAGSTVEANLIASIDETGDPGSNADYVTPVNIYAAQSMDMGFSIPSLTGRRILSVWFQVRALPINATDLSDNYHVALYNQSDGELYGDVSRTIPTDPGAWFTWGEINPVTGQPWTPADVAEFDSGDLWVRVWGAARQTLKMSRVRLVVFHCAENRVGFGTFDAATHLTPTEPSDLSTWDLAGRWSDDVDLYGLDGAVGSAALTAGTTYEVSVRRPWTGDVAGNAALGLTLQVRDDGGFPAVGGSDTSSLVDYGDGTRVIEPVTYSFPSPTYPPAYVPGSGQARMAAGSTQEPSGIYGVVFGTPDGPEPPAGYNGQPYDQVWFLELCEDDPDASLPKDDARVDTITQEYPTTAPLTTHSYGSLRIVLGAPNLPADDLLLSVSAPSGTASASLSPDDLLAHPDWAGFGKHLLEYVLVFDQEVDIGAGDTPVTATLTAPGTEGGAGWYVGALARVGLYPLDTLADPPPYVPQWAGWGPTGGAEPVEVSVTGGGPISITGNLAAYWQAGLPLPDSIAVSGSAIPHDEVVCAGNCLLDLGYATVTWDVSPLDPESTQIVVQRRDALDQTWRTIGYVPASSTSFADLEARFEVESEYRLRVVGAMEQSSAWSSPPVSITLPAQGVGYTFTSNWLSAVSGVGYVDTYDASHVRDYAFPDAEEVLVRKFSGRDEFVVFRPSETRSETFERRLVMDRILNTDQFGPPAFQHLRALSRAPVPYLAVRDEAGNRWYAAIIATAGEALTLSVATAHWAAVSVIPVSTTPVPPTFAPDE